MVYYNQVMQKEGEQEPPLCYESYMQSHRLRLSLRQVNFNHSGLSSDQRVRSAQIKSIQKFIGRLRSENKNHEAILQQMQSLNLSKYLEEISALMGVCVSERQIPFYTQVATRLNCEYEGIPAMLLKDLLKQFTLAYEAPEDNKHRLKAILLFTTELFVCGFPFPYRDINEMLKKLVKAGTKKRNNFTTQKELRLFAYFYNCDIYAAFLLQFGTIFTLATPLWNARWTAQGKTAPAYPAMVPAKTREDFTNIFFNNYINSCASVLTAAFERIKEIEEELRQNLRMSGDFNRQLETTYNELKEKFLFTKTQLQVIIQAMSSGVTLKKWESELVEVQEIMKKYINKVDNVEVFENEFERQLYTDLPDLVKTQNKAATQEEYRGFKEKLDGCKNKTESEQAARAFQPLNNKRTRKLLVRDILQYRKQYQLVTPFLCRIAAVVAVNYRDVVEWLVQALFGQYEKLRENININFVVNDKRSRNLKYICEFTKFKLIDPERMLTVVQNLIDDLKGFNIQLLISALESVGRFLYLAPLHANKFTFILSKLQNVMKQKSFPLFTTSQLLNSINLLKPYIETPKPPTLPPTPAETEAEGILSKDVLSEIEAIISGVYKLVKSPEGLQAVQKNLMKQIQHYDFLGNYNYAYLISELAIEQATQYVISQTVDRLKEAVRSGNYQNCLLWARFFGQLYKYELVKRNFLFDSLLQFLDEGNGELGVINLVCTTLQTCHGYLDSKRVHSRNQRFLFLVEFEKYIHRCPYVPMLEEFKIIDVLDDLEPNLTAIKPDVLTAFLAQVQDKKNNKQFDLSKALDGYLDKRNLKQDKKPQNTQPKDLRSAEKEVQLQQTTEQRNSELLAAEAKTFDSEFLNVMSSHIKDLSGRIAKPAFVEKVIERRRERKKAGEGEQKRTIIGRCGNKFVKKEVVFQAESVKGGEEVDSRQE